MSKGLLHAQILELGSVERLVLARDSWRAAVGLVWCLRSDAILVDGDGEGERGGLLGLDALVRHTRDPLCGAAA